MKKQEGKDKPLNRRDFIMTCGRTACVAALAGTGLYVTSAKLANKNNGGSLWQIDPSKCIQCGQCATECVLSPSAVKCVHVYSSCGYCDLCGGYFQPNTKELNEGAENRLCPTDAIKRKYIEKPYYEYSIDDNLCIGCAKCVQGCSSFGNGSLVLQIKEDLCLNCNECNIAIKCPSQAIKKQEI